MGQTVTQNISIEFFDAGTPNDPNTPVVMSPSYGNPLQSIGQVSGDYSVSIQGADSQMFSAVIIFQNAWSNACIVKVSYNPTAEGTHQAILKVNCSGAGVVSPVSVNLTGVATTEPNNLSDFFSAIVSNGVVLTDGITTSSGILNDSNDDIGDGSDLIGEGVEGLISVLGDIFADPEGLVFPVTTVGETATATFEVWGINVSANAYNDIKVRLSDKNDVFSTNPKVIHGYQIDIQNGGQRKKIEVTYKPTTPGRHKARITLWTFPTVRWVDFEAVAIAPNINVSNSIINYGQTSKDTEAHETFTVWGHGLKGNVSLSSDNPYFTVNPSYITAAEAQNGKPVTVTYNPTAAGTHTGILTISGVGVDDVPVSTPVSLSGKCDLPVLTCNVSAINFRTVDLGDDDTETIIINGSNLTEDLTITSNNQNFTVAPTTISRNSVIPVGASYGNSIAVTYKPTTPGTHSGIITISGSGVSAVVNVTGQCIGTPAITVDQTLLNFGTVNLGDDNPTQRIVVTGTNLTSNLNLSISGASHNMFTVQPHTISPADAAAGRTVVVTYKPTAAGNNSAILTIRGGGADSVTVRLSGKCVEPSLTASTTDLNMGSTYVGTSKTDTLRITGVNLSSPITLVEPWMETLDGNEFSVTPKTLPKTGGTVTVTYTPSDAHTSGAAFKFKSGNMFVNVCVTAKGLAVPRITTNPSSLDYETVAKNSNNTKKFTVRGYDLTGDLTITPASSSYFTVNPTTITAEQAMSSNGAEVTVTYKPTAAGNHSATFSINGEGATSKTVSVSGKCASLSASTTELDMGSTYVGTPLTGTFTITGVNLSDPITLVQPWAETIGGEFTISPTTLPKTGGTITVTYKPTDAHTSGAAFKFKSGNMIVNVAVTAKGLAVPRITTDPTSLDFGTVAKNSTNTKKFTVRGYNLTGNLTITPESSSYFTVSPTTITAAQAQSANGVEVTVKYKPTAAGNHSATFTISGGGATSKTVSVSGKCASLTASTTELDMGSTYVGTTLTATFTLTGTNLSEAITLVQPWAETIGGEFSISPTTLPKTGGTVTVTFTPSGAHTSGAAFKFKSGNMFVNVAVTAKGVSSPKITTSVSSLHFSAAVSKTFKVTGTNLTGSLTVKSSNAKFTVSPSTISASDAAAGKYVTVTYHDTDGASNASGIITISGGGAPSKTVSVTYAKGIEPQAGLVEPEDEGDGGNDEFPNIGLQEAFGSPTADVNELEINSKIYADRLNIIIESPVEQKAVISDIAGHIREVNLQAGRNEIPVNASGIYIVRIREKSTKLMLK